MKKWRIVLLMGCGALAGWLAPHPNKILSFSAAHPTDVRLNVETATPHAILTNKQDARIETAATHQIAVTAVQEPENLEDEEPLIGLCRSWAYQATANISGKSGNTDEKSMGSSLLALLNGEKDTLKLYASYDRKATDGNQTTDERKAGLRYTSYFTDLWGWYIRQDLEKDNLENIQLRSVTAAGLSFRLFNLDHKKLSANTGISYRHEAYQNSSSGAQTMGLDLGLQHVYRMKNRFEIHNDLAYLPSVEDLANYLATQNSYADFPLGNSTCWKIRIGLRNDYNSQPEGGHKGLDTTYYSSLVADWK